MTHAGASPCQILTIFRFAEAEYRHAAPRRRKPASRLFRPMFIVEAFSKLSVRARIIVLGVIPVIGFLANGIAFMVGDVEVGRAFDSVQRYSQVADASRDLKTGLLIMRAATTEYVARPSDKDGCGFRRRPRAGDEIARPHRRHARRFRAGRDHAAAHHRARPQDQLRKPGQRAEIARLRRQPRHHRRAHRGEQRGGAHHPPRSVVGRRRRRPQDADVASDHAPRRDRLPIDALARVREALPRRSQELQRAVRVGRRRAVDEAEAERGSEDL